MHLVWQMLEDTSRMPSREGVSVFRFAIAPSSEIQPLRSLLNDDEQQRHAGFKSQGAAAQFLMCRAALRVLLGRMLGTSPTRIHFNATETGKLFLPDNRLYFNVSHTERWGMVAISSQYPVGVDVEQHKELPDSRRIAQRVFSSEECQRVCDAQSEAARLAVFYQIWTMKEACVKALGLGLRADTRSFTVAAAARDDYRPVLAHADVTVPWTQCRTLSLPMPQGWSAALAVQTSEAARLPEPECYTVQHIVPD